MNAIVCLCRAYPTPERYSSLIERNLSVYEHINSLREHQYPLIIWHEGNISAEHQQFILSREKNKDVRFIDVSSSFCQPSEADYDYVDAEHFPLGYRRMCRFYTYQIWEHSANFEYIFRLDEDCVLKSVSLNPLIWARNFMVNIAPVRYEPETYGPTNETLSTYVRQYVWKNLPQFPPKDFYDHNFPYTNLCVVRVDFMRSDPVHPFLSAMVNSPHFIKFRWGDLPILGVAMNLFMQNHQVIPGIRYWHGSHQREESSPC